MAEENRASNVNDRDAEQTLPLSRRGVLATGAGGLFSTGIAGGHSDDEDSEGPPHAHRDHDHSGENGSTARLGVTAPVKSITARSVNDVRHVHAAAWDDRLQDEIDDAAAAGERYLVVHGVGVFEPRTTVSLPDDFTLRIDDNVRLVPPEDHELDEIPVGNRTYRTLVTNADHESGNENVGIEGGSVSFENVAWDERSHAPVWFHNCVDPLQEDVTVEDVAYDYGNQSGTRQFGVYLSECEGGIQRDCIARRVGYDGIANRGYGPNRSGKMIGCEAYDIPGTGIQFAGDVRNRRTPWDAEYLDSFEIRDCKTDAYIAVHSGGDGATDGLIADNDARVISFLADGPLDNMTLRDNIVERQLVAIRDEITNLMIRGQQNRDEQPVSSIRLIGYGARGSIDTLTISDCFSRQRTFLQNELHEQTSVDHVRLINNVFDPAHDDATFVDGSIEPFFGGDGAQSDLQQVDILGNTIHNATVIKEGVDTVRLQDNRQVDTTPPGIRYDTSDLLVEATATVDDSFDEAIQFEPDEPGDWWEFEFDVPEGNAYDVEIEALFGPSTYGIYELYINGELVDTIDFYADGSGREVLTYELDLPGGTNTMRFEAIDRNEEATDYKMAVYYLDLLDEAAREGKGIPVSSGDVPRLLRNGRGTNAGDPSEAGEWHGHADFAEESNALIRDTVNGEWYRALDGRWVRV